MLRGDSFTITLLPPGKPVVLIGSHERHVVWFFPEYSTFIGQNKQTQPLLAGFCPRRYRWVVAPDYGLSGRG